MDHGPFRTFGLGLVAASAVYDFVHSHPPNCIANLHGSEAMMTCMDNCWLGALEVAWLAGKRSAVGAGVGALIFVTYER